MLRLPLYQVDAFVDAAPFTGNPAAVCPLEAWPDDALMQAIAMENNQSETAFFVPGGTADAPMRLRWFTPTKEAAFCGHATLASGHVFLTRLRPEAQSAVFDTRAGRLTVTRAAAIGGAAGYALDLPADGPQAVRGDHPDRESLAAALGTPVEAVAEGRTWVAFLESAEAVAGLEPDLREIAKVPADGVIVTAPGGGEIGAGIDFVSRFFAPQSGIPEDPVTGSAHCRLAPYWAGRLGRQSLTARQLSPRGGTIRCTVAGDRVRLEGAAIDYLEGTIAVPAPA
ncbi:MAG: PhzF family phenazine biosynthesis isomerase [Azospirillaceae bacterium]